MPARKKAAKKAAPKKKAAAKKATSRKSTAKSSSRSKAVSGAGLASLLSKIQVELENGNKRKFSKADIAKAQECLSKTGKILVSFKRVDFGDGTGSGGTGTQLID